MAGRVALPVLILGPGIAFLRFGPVWQTIYPLFVLMVIVDLGLTASRVIWPRWTQGGQVSRLIMSILGLIVLYFLINAPDLFVAADASTPQLQVSGEEHQLLGSPGGDRWRDREHHQRCQGVDTARREPAGPGSSGDRGLVKGVYRALAWSLTPLEVFLCGSGINRLLIVHIPKRDWRTWNRSGMKNRVRKRWNASQASSFPCSGRIHRIAIAAVRRRARHRKCSTPGAAWRHDWTPAV